MWGSSWVMKVRVSAFTCVGGDKRRRGGGGVVFRVGGHLAL